MYTHNVHTMYILMHFVMLTLHHHVHGIDPLVTASRITKVEVGAIP